MPDQPEQQPGANIEASAALVSRTPGDLMRPDATEPQSADAISDSTSPIGVPAVNLLRSKWLILGIFALVSTATVPVVWLVVQPKFQATATVRVAPTIPRLVFEPEDSGMHRFFGLYMNTQMSNIKNPVVLQRVLEREEIRQTAWFDEQPRTWRTLLGSPPPNKLECLRSALNIENEKHTELIAVQMVTTEAAGVDVLVNAVVDEYLRYTKETNSEQEGVLFKTLYGEREVLSRQIEEQVELMGNLSKQLGTDDPDIVRSQLATQLGELEMEHKSLSRTHQLTVWALDRRRSTEGAGAPAATGTGPNLRYAADREWSRLHTALGTAQHELDTARHHYGESHPRIAELRSGVERAERLLRQYEARLGPQGWPGGTGSTVPPSEDSILFLDQSTLASLAEKQKRELELLGAQIAALKSEQGNKGELAKQVAQLADQLRRTRELYETVHTRIQTLEMEQKAPARISVAARAVEPSEPYHDRRLLMTLMALGGALLTGVVVAQLRSGINPRICEVDDVQRTVRTPFLGQLPAAPPVTSLVNDGDPAVAECMRMVRTALLERLSGTESRVVLITSACSRAGKTSVAIELAKSLAHLGKNTLLVEADLRRPALADRVGIRPQIGLGALLTGSAKEKQVILPSQIPRLDLLLAGEQLGDFDPERLANGVFASCLRRWKKAYDFILLDSPPVLPVADARILAGQADGTLMVLRASHSRRSEVVQAYADLHAAGGRLLGSVLVGVRAESSYGHSYGYHPLPRPPEDPSPVLRS